MGGKVYSRILQIGFSGLLANNPSPDNLEDQKAYKTCSETAN